jgi:flagellar hook-basal body complex protein FliE
MKIESVQLPDFEKISAQTEKVDSKQSFVEALNDSIKKVGEIEKEADNEIKRLATMETQDIHNTMIAIEKADATFQLMMQIRNKIISAYEEIMRMQV